MAQDMVGCRRLDSWPVSWRLHQGGRKLDADERDGYTLLLGFRSWEFAASTALRRK